MRTTHGSSGIASQVGNHNNPHVKDDRTFTFLLKRDCSSDDINCLEVPAGFFDIAARYYLPPRAIQYRE